MTTRHLESFFQPRSIAVIGASETQPSVGGVALRNLMQAGFAGRLSAVNTKKYDGVFGVPCFTSVRKLPEAPDLAILCTPPETIPRLIRELGRERTKAALILMGGLSGTLSKSGRPLTDSVREAARPSGIRVLGPNSLGVLVPKHRLNASYAHIDATAGDIAYVGDSAVLGTAVMDWARGRGIGFSHFLTLGDAIDVDLPDVIDYIASDTGTRAILLHIERIHDARRFISSVRAASRGKLVVALKSGRVAASQLIPQAAAPGVPNVDMVYDAVFHRAGVLRVGTLDELFAAVETLTRMQPLRGERLAIVSNGFGPAALAVDALARHGGTLAQFTAGTRETLGKQLAAFARHDNPVDLSVVASPSLYTAVLENIRRDPGVDAVLVVHAPSRRADSREYADAIIQHFAKSHFNILTSWMGDASVEAARRAFDDAGMPTYDTPDQAVVAFMHMARHRRNQEHLRETPSAVMAAHEEDREHAQNLVKKVAKSRRDFLDAREVRQLVSAYGIPVAETHYVRDLKDAAKLHKSVGRSAALKIIHSAHCHPFAYSDRPRSPWRGIRFDLASAAQLQAAGVQLQEWLAIQFPESRMLGFIGQRMRRGEAAMQVSVGVTRDPVFGPLLFFGMGGRQVNVLADRRVGLPPLNRTLALDLIRSSHVNELLTEGTRHPEEHFQHLAEVMVALSQMVAEVPQLRGLEINPLMITREGMVAVDMAADLGDPQKMTGIALRPYPQELCGRVTLADGRLVELRPIRGEDEPAHAEFHKKLSPETIRFRYFYNRRHFSHAELAQMTQIDYEREMVFIASAKRDDATEETLGEVRTWRDPDNIRAEFSVVVRDDQRGQGVARLLMDKMISYCWGQGTLEIVGTVLPDNEPMLKLARALGFHAEHNSETGVVDMKLLLNKPKQEWQKVRLQQPVS